MDTVTLRETWDGWELSSAPNAPIRGRELAESLVDASLAEIWTIHLSQRTLAKGDALLEYICRAKILNGIPKTEEEQIYVDSLRPTSPKETP